jgi:hypothetical protein
MAVISLQAQAAQAFAVELSAGRVPSVRAIRARLHVGNQVPSEYDLRRAGGAAARPLAHRTRRAAATLAGRLWLVSDQASAR